MNEDKEKTIANLKELLAYVEAEGVSVRMRAFFINVHDLQGGEGEREWAEYTDYKHWCGTCACLFGWSTKVFPVLPSVHLDGEGNWLDAEFGNTYFPWLYTRSEEGDLDENNRWYRIFSMYTPDFIAVENLENFINQWED